jgi:AAA15 family ATPase/GTPase
MEILEMSDMIFITSSTKSIDNTEDEMIHHVARIPIEKYIQNFSRGDLRQLGDPGTDGR